MDLRTGCEFWTRSGEAARFGALQEDLECEVAIIGGGITGAMAAHELVAAGMQVVLLDKRNGVARGSTAASTALLQYEIDKPLVELSRSVGADAARRAYLLGIDALDQFQSLTGELHDDCDFARRKSLLLAHRDQAAELLRYEYDARRAIGIRVDLLSSGELIERGFPAAPAGLLSQDAAEIDPHRFTCKLIERSVSRGAQVYIDTRIVEYHPHDTTVTLKTEAGHRVRARHVVFATGYETPPFLDPSLAELHSTYALATEPISNWSGWPENTLIWETGSPYFYARTTRDGRILAGGEDVPFVDPRKRDALIAQKTEILERKLRHKFPRIDFQVSCAWAGTFAQTADSLPYIGPHPRFPLGQFALGYGGNGITFGLIAAQLIRDSLTGHSNPDLHLFSFARP